MYIEEMVEKAEEEMPYFLQGFSCSLEEQSGLGKRLVNALADHVIAKKQKARIATRARRKEVLSRQGSTQEETWKLLEDYRKRCEREDVLDVFDSFDSDCSGTIDIDELDAAIQALGLTLSM